jgi:cysteine desulfurase/selenocysteine lyase
LASLEYLESIGGYRAIEAHERELTEHVLSRIADLPSSIRLLGSHTAEHRLDVFSFAFANAHPHDVAEYLADNSICVRS